MQEHHSKNGSFEKPPSAPIAHRTDPELGKTYAPGPGEHPVLPPRPGPQADPRQATPRVDTPFDFVTGGQVIVVEGEHMLAVYPLCRQGQCRIRLFDHSAGEGRMVVLATDLDQGVSVTNAVEDIAAQVCLRYRLHPDQVTFVEHYDDRAKNIHPRAGLRRTNGESFDLVSFPERKEYNFGTPHWRPTTKAEVEALIGGQLP